jgi:RNA-splicing ligase RtcB
MGQAIRDHHLGRATEGRTGLSYIDAGTEHGRAYLHDASWALRYAEESRRSMAQAIAELLRELLSVDADWNSFVTRSADAM